MIIIKPIGGLGNQMFQYATARRLAYIHKTDLKFDLTELKKTEKRKYMLDCFNIIAKFATPQEVKKMTNPFISRITRSYFKEKFYSFDSKVLKLPDNVSLIGYFQSEKYFRDIETIIRKDFTFKNNPDEKNKIMLRKINSSNSIGIHFRRKDYVNEKKTNIYHGVCPLDYYYKAISIINSCVKTPHFFVFSDDLDWVRANLKVRHSITFVEQNVETKDHEDLRLMSSCKHNIIANSSFSWWGAWLNTNKEKKAIAPNKWFSDRTVNTDDLIPESWIRI